MNGRPCSSFITEAIVVVSHDPELKGARRRGEINLETNQVLDQGSQSQYMERFSVRGISNIRIAILTVCQPAGFCSL
jgi:hypothetical protein